MTPDEVSTALFKVYHRNSLELGARKVFEQGVDEREFGSLTFSVNAAQIPELKQKIKAFIGRIQGYMDLKHPEGTEVYQLGVQLFRLSEKAEGSE